MSQIHIYSSSDWELLLDSANEHNKRILLKGYTENCPPCGQMGNEWFQDSLIRNRLEENYIEANLNLQEGIGLDIAMKYRVYPLPAHLFFNSEGRLLYKSNGVKDINEFLTEISNAENPELYLPALNNPDILALNYPDFYLQTMRDHPSQFWPADTSIIKYLNSRKDHSDEISWAILHKFIDNGAYLDTIIKLKPKLISLYGEKEIYQKLEAVLYKKVKIAIKEENYQLLKETLDYTSLYLDEYASEARTRFRNFYYHMSNNWHDYLKETEDYFDRHAYGNKEAVADYCRLIYFNSQLTNKAEVVIKHLNHAVNAEANYELMHLLAEIYFYEKNYSEALNLGLKAKNLGTENSKDISKTVTLLQKINSP